MGSAAKCVSTPVDLSTVNVERDTACLDHPFAQILMSVVRGLINAIRVDPHRLAVSTLKGATGVLVMNMLGTV
jgi:hypothetical protein